MRYLKWARFLTMADDYYNTTGLSGTELRTRIANAKNQDDRLLFTMALYQGKKFTRDELHKIALSHALIVSVGRALNTLKKKGYIEKLDEYRMGDHGHRQHLWQIKRPESQTPQQQGLF